MTNVLRRVNIYCVTNNGSRWVNLSIWTSKYKSDSPLGQNGRHLADDVFWCMLVNKNTMFWYEIPRSCFLRIQLKINQHLFRVMVCRRTGDMPLPEPMLPPFTDEYMRSRGRQLISTARLPMVGLNVKLQINSFRTNFIFWWLRCPLWNYSLQAHWTLSMMSQFWFGWWLGAVWRRVIGRVKCWLR